MSTYLWYTTPGYNESLDSTLYIVHDLNSRNAEFTRSRYDVYIDGTKLNNASVLLLSGGSNYINLRDFASGLARYSNKSMEVIWQNARDTYPYIMLLPGIEYTPVGGELTARAAFDKNTDKVTAIISDSLYAVYGVWTRVANLRVKDTQTYSTSNFVRVRDLCKIMNVAVTFDTTAIYIDSSQPYTS